ncbi:MAG TPA: hypothetical protein VKZ95_07825 [Sphingobacteriaceae bacterium]|nr:hypothetical protein [Sphingobacteriaceae bacterium]
MKFKIGDFVRFVDEEGEGYVTSIISDELVGVTDADGFEVPVLASKVTSVFGRMESGEKEEKVTAATRVEDGPFLTEGLSLAIAGDQRQGLVEFFLINESSYEVLFSFGSLKSGQLKGEKRGILEPKSVEKIYTANASTVGDWPIFNFQFLFHTSIARGAKKSFSIDQKIRPADLSTSKKHVPLLDNKAWVFKLEEAKSDLDTEKLKEHFFSHRPSKKE